ncbi:MAG: YbaB/EbfC family nucleoid-associated protein [Saprospiraceae bacterium]|nr:YbaB/EbfC family nucleoid-associated protein [Saprospiraceae bacterium]MBL0101659.1 YbaB/EbfC family nucleoid-associated protein [Saprospiraceae bacterium]
MFGDLMGNLEQQQAEMQKKLAEIPVEIKMDGITITGNATKQITNILLDAELVKGNDKEMLEDLLLAAFNRFMESAVKLEADAAQKLMSELMPPGFEDMFK